ncbi:MAG: PAS domain S-box protein [Acidobacteria bacterium]|nr:PAS domain S-box protein [Acidobacteriota bacterium]
MNHRTENDAVPAGARRARPDDADAGFRQLADALPALIWISGPDGRCTWFNQQWLAFVDRRMDQEVGEGWTEHVHPDDIVRVLRTYGDAVAARAPFDLQYRIRRHDGVYRWLLDQGTPFVDAEGAFAGFTGSCVDITDQMQAGRAQAYLAAIVESSDDAIIAKDLNGIIQSCNASAERLFGYTAAELVGRPVRILIPAERQFEEDDILARMRRGESIDHFETVRVRKDGSLIDISLSVSPVRDFTGAIIGVSKVARDITAQKRVAADLAAQQAWFRTTLGSIGDAVIATDPEGRVTYLNAMAERISQWPMAEAAGRPIDEVVRIVDEKTRRPIASPVEQVLRIGTTVGGNHALLLGRRGTSSPIAHSAAPIATPEGERLGVVFVFRDVTEERRAEARLAEQREWLETTLRSIGDAVIATDDRGRIVFMNAVAEELTGWPATAAAGRECRDIFRIVNEQSRRQVESPVDRVLEEGKVVGLANHTLLIAADGTERPIDDSGAPIRDPDGRVTGVVLVFRDITERHRLDVERAAASVERERLLEAERTARGEAERASRVKDDFVAMVSHELRTPLNAILGWTQLMMQSGQDRAVIDKGLEVVARNTRIQAQLISDLLDISRIVAGKLQLEIQRVELEPIINDAIETIQREADAKDVRIRRELDPNAGSVAGDSARLQQIVWNLVSNAVKFTPAGGTVSIALRARPGKAEIVVSDSGAGMRPETLPYIFDRFHQADRSITRRFGGLGLGLAIVKHLVDLHGGTVRAESAGEGRGSTFTVLLPTSTAVVATPAEDDASPLLAVDDGMSLGGMRILVVEDEPDTREYLSRLLEAHDAVVLLAKSAAEALEIFRLTRPDLLVSDIGLPEIDGYDLIRRIRRGDAGDASSLPAIALTAYARTEDRMRALRAGFQGHLAKPVEAAELLAAVASFRGVVESQQRSRRPR